jgi:hypothetical protein
MKDIQIALQYVCRGMKADTYFQENSNDYLTNRNGLLFLSSQYCKLEDKYVIKPGPLYIYICDLRNISKYCISLSTVHFCSHFSRKNVAIRNWRNKQHAEEITTWKEVICGRKSVKIPKESSINFEIFLFIFNYSLWGAQKLPVVWNNHSSSINTIISLCQ